MSGNMTPARLESVVRRLSDMTSRTVRKDYRETAQSALTLIGELSRGMHGGKAALASQARRIADRAAVRPVLVYRTKKTGEVRWQAADTASVFRIPPGQVIGVYDGGSDYRRILEDLQA